MDKDKLTIWTVEEIVDDSEYQQKEKQLYEKEEVDDAFSSIYQKVYEALKIIEGILKRKSPLVGFTGITYYLLYLFNKKAITKQIILGIKNIIAESIAVNPIPSGTANIFVCIR